jgi:hypothetical protein
VTEPIGASRLLISALAVFLAGILGAQQPSDTLKGRVVDATGHAVSGATIALDFATGTVPPSTVTGDSGFFALVIAHDTGTVAMTVRAIGMRPRSVIAFRQKFLTVTLISVFSTLGPTRVTAQRRNRPDRFSAVTQDPAAVTRTVGFGSLPPSQQGDVASMAGAIPGVSVVGGDDITPPGFSVLGLSAAHNVVTLDGLKYSAAQLPRDAAVTSRMTTSTFDASIGGFSAGQFDMRTLPGTNNETRELHVTHDPQSQAWLTSPAFGSLMPYSDWQVSGDATGSLRRDRIFYTVAGQFTQRLAASPWITRASDAILGSAHVSPDSARVFNSTLRGFALPLPSLSAGQLITTGSAMARVDFTPDLDHSYFLSALGRRSTAAGIFLNATSDPSHGGSLGATNSAVRFGSSTYWRGSLVETRIGLSHDAIRATPLVSLPDGEVLVGSSNADSSIGVATLSFGGNAALPQASETNAAELSTTLDRYTRDNAHEFKLGVQSRLERAAVTTAIDTVGTFYYPSLQALSSGGPIAFSRNVGGTSSASDAITLAVSGGDIWRPTTRLRIQYGLRWETTSFVSPTGTDTSVQRQFGVQMGVRPTDAALSSRLGIAWTYGQHTAAVGALPSTPAGSIRLGIGRYHDTPGAASVAAVTTGPQHDGETTTLSCYGDQVPQPQWAAWIQHQAVTPKACAGSTSATAGQLTNATFFSNGFRFPDTWRSTATWTGAVTKWFNVSTEGTYSLESSNSSAVDVNFSDKPQFFLADENGRPVFVDPHAAAATGGPLNFSSSRRSTDYGFVSKLVSDVASRSAELSVAISQSAVNPSYRVGFVYTLRSARDSQRGFSGSTAGDPLAVDWGRSAGDVTHQIAISVAHTFGHAIFFTAYARIHSGLPFTPLVGSDINGDGLANDRAFIPNPRVTQDSALGRQIGGFLQTAPQRLRNCLTAQFDRIASRNSCDGPWGTSLLLQAAMNPAVLGLSDRLYLSVSVSNALGGLDAVLHGSQLRGWGNSSPIDPTLLYVRAFDQPTNTYRYTLNPGFGSSVGGNSGISSDPFRVTLEARIALGPSPAAAATRALIREAHASQPSSAAQLRQRYAATSFNPFTTVLLGRDSLHLSPLQVSRINDLNRMYAHDVDSLLVPLSAMVAASDGRNKSAVSIAELSSAQESLYQLLVRAGRTLRAELSRSQVDHLPLILRLVVDDKGAALLRPVLATGFGASFFRE